MELKDVILQALTEIENIPDSKESKPLEDKTNPTVSQSDLQFLQALREKTLVLFEGLQSSQIKDLPTKLELVINYLQYQLSVIDEKLGN